MAEPRVPGGGAATLSLPCGERVTTAEIDMGMREYACDCGADHAVVADVHPLTRFVPDFLVRVLEETVDTADDFPAFGTPHLMGMVLEEFPDRVAVADAGEDGDVGYAMVWVADFDSRRLHEVAVELLVELMDHAVSHGDEAGAAAFEREMRAFDVEEFVDQYRRERDFEDEHDTMM